MYQPMLIIDERLEDLLNQSAARHSHLCPRQVLGVRMGLYAGEILDLPVPQHNKRIFTFVETDGCFVDGIEVSSGCSLGHRTLRLRDYGKVAATFVDTLTNQAVRLSTLPSCRQTATEHEPHARSRWHSQLAAYQTLSYKQLFKVECVNPPQDMKAIISRPGVRVNCSICYEEVINEREIWLGTKIVCLGCLEKLVTN